MRCGDSKILLDHCLSLFCYLVCVILLFTLFKFERFEDRLSL